jgi:L-rhamnose-H+ transport protein
MSGTIPRGTSVLFAGIVLFLLGVGWCGQAGRIRNREPDPILSRVKAPFVGYVFATVSGVISAIFNIGYTLALPIADAGVSIGNSRFASTNCIWMLMLGAGSIPNIVYCATLMKQNGTGGLLFARCSGRSWFLSSLMGILWAASIFLYGAATPRLGALGPSVGWPLSLAFGLLIANLMGVWLGEWRGASSRAIGYMRTGIVLILAGIAFCAVSTRMAA